MQLKDVHLKTLEMTDSISACFLRYKHDSFYFIGALACCTRPPDHAALIDTCCSDMHTGEQQRHLLMISQFFSSEPPLTVTFAPL